MSDEATMENYHGIVDNLQRIIKLENQILVLDRRILKLEAIIVKLCNEDSTEEFLVNAEHLCDEPHVDFADTGQMREEEKEGYNDR